MTFALVLFHDAKPGAATSLSPADLAVLRKSLREVPGILESLIFTPAAAEDLYVDDGAAPPLGLQLHFAGLSELEAAAAADGMLASLPANLPSLAGTRASAQAFWRRDWPVPEPELQNPKGALPCSYVVHYPGPAADANAWHDHYLRGHPPLFQRLPGIRAIEILTGVEWVSHLPHEKTFHLQRNRVTFDSPQALTAALQSPVRHELRADFHNFPAFEGGNFHYPMWVESLHV
jgi:uncharacterized protein (TIGR02118 family)